MKVAYLCRGMGWAHAARAALVLPRLREMSTVDIAASGAAVDLLDLAGIAHHDLRVPDDLDHSGYAAHRIRAFLDDGPRPDVVFSDELCLAPLVCRAIGVPCVLMVCSFRHYRERPVAKPAFAAAGRILLANWTAVSEVPESLRHKTTAIGPIVREQRGDRPTARAEVGLPAGSFVATASFGNLHPTKRAYFATALGRLLRAWRHAPGGAVLVVPLTEATVRELTDVSIPGGVRCVGPTARMNDYHQASDVVFTVGGSTTNHVVRTATPTVVLTPPPGSIDHRNATYLATVTPLVTITTGDESPAELGRLIVRHSTQPRTSPVLRWGSADDLVAAFGSVQECPAVPSGVLPDS